MLQNAKVYDVVIKSNRTALQAYKEEERTFGTPCRLQDCLVETIFEIRNLKLPN